MLDSNFIYCASPIVEWNDGTYLNDMTQKKLSHFEPIIERNDYYSRVETFASKLSVSLQALQSVFCIVMPIPKKFALSRSC